MPRRFAPSRWLAIAALALLAGCAGATDGAEHPGDPYEASNRAALERNLFLYDTAIEPVVRAYRRSLPDALRQGLSNAFDNLATPRILVNDLLQAEWQRAAETFGRFLINSSIGFAGLFDRAAQMGIARHDEDFGQTLAVYGAEETPYLVLPLIGPSNPRDAVGHVVDLALDPINYLLFPVAFAANLTGSTMERFARDPDTLETLRLESIDVYATLRGAYAQQRAHEIRNGAQADDALEEMDAFDRMDGPDDIATGAARPDF
jgi:phospholipid-binding lipoprotein MlaA